MATAIGGGAGFGILGNGSEGAAVGISSATTTNGQQATAHTMAQGSSGVATSTASTGGSVINSLNAFALGQVGSTTTTESRANVGQAVSGLDATGLNSYAFATGIPGGSFVSDALSTHPNIGAAFAAADATVLGTGAQGAFYSANALGAHGYSSTISWELDSTNLEGHLLVGLLNSSTFGGGFDTLNFEIDENGLVALVMTFTSAADATSFFSDNLLDLGTFSTSIPPRLGLYLRMDREQHW
jgi:hypothetical protein